MIDYRQLDAYGVKEFIETKLDRLITRDSIVAKLKEDLEFTIHSRDEYIRWYNDKCKEVQQLIAENTALRSLTWKRSASLTPEEIREQNLKEQVTLIRELAKGGFEL